MVLVLELLREFPCLATEAPDSTPAALLITAQISSAPAAVTSMDKLPAVHLTRRDSRHLLIEAETSPFDSGCCPSDMPRGSGRLGVVTGPVSDGGHRLLLAESGPGSEHLTELVVPQLLADLGY